MPLEGRIGKGSDGLEKPIMFQSQNRAGIPEGIRFHKLFLEDGPPLSKWLVEGITRHLYI